MTKDSMSSEDKELFRRAMLDVKPLNKSVKNCNPPTVGHVIAVKKSATADYESKKTKKIETRAPAIVHLSNYSAEPVQAESIVSFCRAGFSKERFNELKKGQIAWQATLDLHGFTSDSAEKKFLEFMNTALRLLYRSVVIIHGKGSVSREAPILKNLINNWLRQIPEVMAFHSALPQHGGSGAVYIFLKKNKK